MHYTPKILSFDKIREEIDDQRNPYIQHLNQEDLNLIEELNHTLHKKELDTLASH